MAEATAAWIAIAATAASTGYSIYQSNQASKVALHQGNLDAQSAQLRARAEGAALQQQAQIAAAQANQEKRAGEAQAQNLRDVAQNLRDQAGIEAIATADATARARQEAERFRASQAASFAASGLSAVGTPLEILAETAGEQQLEIVENNYQRDLQRRDLLQGAKEVDFAAAESEFGASQSQLAVINARAQGAAGGFRARQGAVDAIGIRNAAYAQSQGYRSQAIGSALSGAASIAGTASNYRRKSVKPAATTTNVG